MSDLPRLHTPRVEVIAPVPHHGAVANVLSLVFVDDHLWPVVSYVVTGKGVGDLQTVTITFLADVTVTHERPS